MKILTLLFITLVPWASYSHPGIGTVRDSKGNIFYTDLKNIWKHTPSGELSIVVPDVHSHELFMDREDNLFGEHLWYVAETEKFLHYAWRLDRDGKLDKVKDTSEAYTVPWNYSFVCDTAGNMYWFEETDVCRFFKSNKEGKTNLIATCEFTDIRWMFSSPSGEVFFLDLEDLFTISDRGECHLVAKDLAIGNMWTLLFGNDHSVFGLWQDSKKNIYVAVVADRCVKKITPHGKVSIVSHATDGWVPTSGLFDEQGNLWLLENKGAFDYRVRKSEMVDVTPFNVWLGNNGKVAGLLLGLIITLGAWIIWRKRKGQNDRRKRIPLKPNG